MRPSALALLLALAVLPHDSHAAGATTPRACGDLVDYRLTSIRNQPIEGCSLAGKVVLVVNTASYCGYTAQYKGLEALHRQYRSRGLVVLGVPTNDFGEQEPGSNAQVIDFCERTYQVSFPMLAKATTRGDMALPLIARLAERTGSPPKWNFHKYLIGRDGTTAHAFPSAITPDSPELISHIERLLAAK